jgi:hypothetical protein
MKLLWTTLSVLAVANLLALVAFIGWLAASDRLDTARAREVRVMFKETLKERHAREEAEKKKLEDERLAAEARAHAQVPPVPAKSALEFRLDQSQADQARLDGIRREVQILQETLGRERVSLDAEWTKLRAEREDFEKARKVVAETEGNAQFKKTLATLEGLKADKCKSALGELIKGNNIDQAVAYLNAMGERTRTKVLDEFLKEDPKLATDLLERLRTRGLSVAGG